MKKLFPLSDTITETNIIAQLIGFIDYLVLPTNEEGIIYTRITGKQYISILIQQRI